MKEIIALLLLLLAGAYALYVYNDLARRIERLKGLMADIRSIRSRRLGVGQAVSRHVANATRHEHDVTQAATGRNRGRGRFLSVSDNNNGWPNTQAVGTIGQGLTAELQSHNLENQACTNLHREAEQYNGLLRAFPRCLIAPVMGFRPWRFGRGGKPPRRHPQPGGQAPRP